MAQQRSQRMAIVLQLAEKTEQQAAEQLAKAREQLGASEQQLNQLVEYQQEYIAQINAKTRQLTAQEMIVDRSFVGRLGEAAEAQRQKMAYVQNQYQQLLDAWQSAYQKRKGVEDMIQRMRNAESQEADKRLQKELDELASLNHTRKR